MARTITEKERAASQIADRLARENTEGVDRQWSDAAGLHRVADAFAATVTAESELHHAVAAARAEGYSWTSIAAMLGVSRQTAQHRFRDLS
jgi:hypothetical protein